MSNRAELKISYSSATKHRGGMIVALCSFFILFSIGALYIIFCDPPKWLGIPILLPSLFPLTFFGSMTRDYRETRKYLDKDGNTDLTTPREYLAKPVNELSAFIGSAWWRKSLRLRRFYYGGGTVIAETWKGKRIKAPLCKLEVKIVNKTRGKDDRIYSLKYKNQKIKFAHNNYLFEDEEIEDINGILSMAQSYKSSLLSQITDVTSVADQLNIINATAPQILINATGSLIGYLIESGEEIPINRYLQMVEESPSEVKVNLIDESLDITEENKATDEEIKEFIKKLREEPTEFSENEIQNFILNSTEDGRKLLYKAFESNKCEPNREKQLPTLQDSKSLRLTYPLELQNHLVNSRNDDLYTMIVYIIFLLSLTITLFIARTYSLFWVWDIIIFIGVFCGLLSFDSFIGLSKLTEEYKTKLDMIIEKRKEILISLNSNRSIELNLADFHIKRDKLRFCLIAGISIILTFSFILEIFYYFFQ